MNDHELDAEFERIIAGWDETADEPSRAVDQPRRPTEPAIDAPDDPPTAASALPKPGTSLNVPIAPITPHVWRGSPAPDEEVVDSTDDEEEDHFVPPAVHLPSAEDDPMYWATVCCLAGGPLLLLYLLIFDRGGSAWWIVTAVAMTVVGFVMLVLRGGTDRDPFDDGTRV